MITFAFTIRASSYIFIVFHFTCIKTAEKQSCHIVRDKLVFFNADSLKNLYILSFYVITAEAPSGKSRKSCDGSCVFLFRRRIFSVPFKKISLIPRCSASQKR
ncbi:MAG TPA: hypothetical protein DE060_19790 [Lentisphaeria bacterium]|nr:hypothetical protein [Lentisphaeria bacterium]HCG51432.1 hypothetical protein [Lentisphaeria bacterium]